MITPFKTNDGGYHYVEETAEIEDLRITEGYSEHVTSKKFIYLTKIKHDPWSKKDEKMKYNHVIIYEGLIARFRRFCNCVNYYQASRISELETGESTEVRRSKSLNIA